MTGLPNPALKFSASGLLAVVVSCQLINACGDSKQGVVASPSPYTGIQWAFSTLNEEIAGCRERQNERLGVDRSRIYCKCVYIGLSKLAKFEDYNADRSAYAQKFESENGVADCTAWAEKKLQIEQETNHHAITPTSDGDWIDMYTGKQYKVNELFY